MNYLDFGLDNAFGGMSPYGTDGWMIRFANGMISLMRDVGAFVALFRPQYHLPELPQINSPSGFKRAPHGGISASLQQAQTVADFQSIW